MSYLLEREKDISEVVATIRTPMAASNFETIDRSEAT